MPIPRVGNFGSPGPDTGTFNEIAVREMVPGSQYTADDRPSEVGGNSLVAIVGCFGLRTERRRRPRH